MARNIRICEVAPRDGLQNEDDILSVDRRVELIERLIEVGHTDIEVGSFVHPKWVPQMADTEEAIARLPEREDVTYWALVPNRKGFERALQTEIDGIATFMSASESHNQKNVNRSVSESLDAVTSILDDAEAESLETRAYISTAFGCPFEGDIDFQKVLDLGEGMFEAGADYISLGDTIGAGTPKRVRAGVREALELFDRDRIALHFHDTQGMALTNVYVAVSEGIRFLDGSAAGLGGCPYAPGAAGNVGTEDVMYLLESMNAKVEPELKQALGVSEWIDDDLGMETRSRYYKYHRADH